MGDLLLESVLVVLLICSVTLGKSLLSEPQLPHL